MRTVSFLGSDIGFHELERGRWRFRNAHKSTPALSNRIGPKRESIVSKRLFWDAGSFGPIAKFNEIPHDAQRFVANGIGLRTLPSCRRPLRPKLEQVLLLLTIEGDRPQFWRS